MIYFVYLNIGINSSPNDGMLVPVHNHGSCHNWNVFNTIKHVFKIRFKIKVAYKFLTLIYETLLYFQNRDDLPNAVVPLTRLVVCAVLLYVIVSLLDRHTTKMKIKHHTTNGS